MTHLVATFKGSHWRIRDDDGSETAATWLADEDTQATITALATNFRVRFSVAETAGAAGTFDELMQFRVTPDGGSPGSWTDLGIGTGVRGPYLAVSTHFARNDATTAQLTVPDGAYLIADFDTGGMNESQIAYNQLAISVGVSQYTEVELVLALGSTTVSGDVIEFRQTRQ